MSDYAEINVNGVTNVNTDAEKTETRVTENIKSDYVKTPDHDTVEVSSKKKKKKGRQIAKFIAFLTGGALIVDFAINKGRATRHLGQSFKEFFNNGEARKKAEEEAARLREKAEADAKQKAETKVTQQTETTSDKTVEEVKNSTDKVEEKNSTKNDKKVQDKKKRKTNGGGGSGGHERINRGSNVNTNNIGKAETDALLKQIKEESPELRELLGVGENSPIRYLKNEKNGTILAYIERPNGNKLVYVAEEKSWYELNNKDELIKMFTTHPEYLDLPGVTETSVVNGEIMVSRTTIYDKSTQEYMVINEDVMSFYDMSSNELLLSLKKETGELQEFKPSKLYERIERMSSSSDEQASVITNPARLLGCIPNQETKVVAIPLDERVAAWSKKQAAKYGIGKKKSIPVNNIGEISINEIRRLISARGEEKVLTGFNIPKDSRYTLEYTQDIRDNVVIVKENGNVVVPSFRGMDEQSAKYLIPINNEEAEILNDLVININGRKYIEYDLDVKTTPNSQGIIDSLYGEFARKEMKDNSLIYSDSAIAEFKRNIEDLRELIGDESGYCYKPEINGRGDVVLKRKDGTNAIYTISGAEKVKGKPVPKELKELLGQNGLVELDENLNLVAAYGKKQPFEGAPKFPIKLDDKTMTLLDTRTGEISVSNLEVKDAPDIFMSRDGSILELTDGTVETSVVPLRSGKYFYTKGNPPKDYVKVLQLQRVDGGIDYVYEMPDGTLIFPDDFHFPGSAFQRFLTQLAEDAERRNARNMHTSQRETVRQENRILA